MKGFLLRRLVHSVIVILGITAIVFIMVHLSGDPVRLIVPADANEADIERLRDLLGYNDPLYVQYGRFVSGILHGDFGTSLRFRAPALPLLLERLPATLQLAAAALTVSLALAIPAGVLAALYKDTPLDLVAMLVALIGQSIPGFWLGLMLILLFAVELGWLPTSGRGGPETLILPACTLAMFYTGRLARVVRSSMLDVLCEDYIRTARAKGLPEWLITARHALKNASLPVVTIIGLEFGALLSGAVITETVYSWPGVGLLAVNAVLARDFPLVQAIVVFMAMVFVGVNLLVDLLYTQLDPRIRYARG
jgi:ABC-type dipeptide/oligopeptide/nickel transport system permease component